VPYQPSYTPGSVPLVTTYHGPGPCGFAWAMVATGVRIGGATGSPAPGIEGGFAIGGATGSDTC
jgi:hypothetical protein